MTQMEMTFKGKTYNQELDKERLSTQLTRTFEAMNNNGWMTLREITDMAGGSEAGVSARIRDLRSAQGGGYIIEKRRREGCNGLWEYRLV